MNTYNEAVSPAVSMIPRLAIIAPKPIQHFCPLYRQIEQSREVHLRVFFASSAGLRPFYDRDFGQTLQWQDGLVDGFEHEFLTGTDSYGSSDGNVSVPKVFSSLAEFNPDAIVVYGYSERVSRAAMRWARHSKKRILYISDSEMRRERAWWKLCAKKVLLPRVFSKVDAFLTVGDCNEAYYEYYGADRSRFFRSPFPIDQQKIEAVLALKESARTGIRNRYSIPQHAIVALTVGKLTQGKRTEDAIRAMALLKHPEQRENVFLLMVGDGPNREVCKSLAQILCADFVRFAGFVPVAELPAHYVGADFLVHTSSMDAHPLAISEAISCGLPCIVSDRIGSVGPTDDVQLGVNGFEYPLGDCGALAGRIAELESDRGLLRRMSEASFAIARERTLNRCVQGVLAAVKHVCVG